MQKTRACRTHGGVFKYIARKGRPPVDCSKGIAPCTRANGETEVSDPEHVQDATVQHSHEAAESKPKRSSDPAAGLSEAKAAKERLEALGWNATGKAFADDGVTIVTVTAARGDETIVMEWHDGVFAGQQYFAWDMDAPFHNAKPRNTDLGFDPDEIPDRELVRYLRGMKVTWWNRLGESQETAVVGDKITIQHNYVGTADEHPADRIVTFVDHSGGGFRSFRLGALMRLG